MPRAEVGTTKYLNNKLKAKGLQRLRWYCQPCQRQMRDENGFKCHTQSESHVRTMLLIGEDPRKHIQDFSNQFLHDFLQLLRTSHREKQVHINHFYQEYISNKEHIHMNATRWNSLTEFAKHLGREGICRVEESEKGIFISWIDNSPEALRRQDAIRKKERQDKGDEELEKRLIQEQVERARTEARSEEQAAKAEADEAAKALQRAEGEKITLNFGAKSSAQAEDAKPKETTQDDHKNGEKKVELGLGAPKSTTKNVFAAKKNPLAGKKAFVKEPPKKMSEAERIMKEELERKRSLSEANGSFGLKKQRVA